MRGLSFKPWKNEWLLGLEPGAIIQTRRPLKHQPKEPFYEGDYTTKAWRKWLKSKYGYEGDQLYAKEPYRFGKGYDGLKPSLVSKIAKIHYEADGNHLIGQAAIAMPCSCRNGPPAFGSR